ncbi:TPA: hypothetical protein ACYEKQ_002582 [Escherichia coli]
MKMIFTGKVSGEKTVLAAGARHTVKAQAGEQYGLVDEVTGLVPDGVEADRTGDDLILRKKEDDTEIRIEGFWEKCQPGETQCTAVFNVVGENGQVTEAVLTQDGPVLENFTAGQSGTLAEGISNGIIWGGIAFGAGLAAIALLAGGGGGSSRHKSAAGEGQNQVQAEGSQETGKIDGPPTVSTKPVNGNSFGQVPEVNDQDGNGIPDFIDSQLAFFNKASSPNVSGDLYPNAPRFSWSTESNKISTVNKNWEGILNANPGAYVTREVISTNVEQYNYNGINGSDIISIKNSLFGLDRTQVDRQPVGLFTGEGNDIIVTGQDYGRNTSLGYTDHANITNMGGGDDTLVVGAGNNNVTLYVNDDGQLRATTDGYDGLYSINYNQINPGVTGGTISGTDISMGEGNDTILALGTEGNTADAIINTNIDLGQGNDFIYINGNVSSAWNTSVNIRGNEGVDTLFIDNGNISSLQFSGFEVIKLGRNGGVNIREVDLLKSGADAIEGGDLKIIREASSRVKLEGDFIQKGIETVEGVNYLVYSNDNTPGIRILVDTDIPLIM